MSVHYPIGATEFGLFPSLLTFPWLHPLQNAPRIARALFEIVLRRGWSSLTDTMLTVCKSLELQLWPHQHALRQFESVLAPEILWKLEDRSV